MRISKQQIYKSILLFTTVILVFFNIISYLFAGIDTNNADDYIWLICLYICILYLATAIYMVKTDGFFCISNVFWLCLFVFGLSRVFMYVIGIFDFRSANYGIIGEFVWEDSTTITVLNYYFIFMVIYTIGYLLIRPQKPVLMQGKANPVLIYVYYIAALITGVYYILKAILVLRLGYVSIYNGEASGQIPFESAFSLARLLFVCCYYFIIAYDSRKHVFIKTSIVFLIVNGVALIQGSRAEFLVFLLTAACIYSYRYNWRIKIGYVVIALLIGIPMLEAVSYIRSGLSINAEFFANCYVQFFTELSGSFNIPAFYIQHKTELNINSYPYIFEPLMKAPQYFQNWDIYRGGQSLEMVKIRFNLGHQISYLISHEYYLSGHNFASNFIAEMAEFGYLGVIAFSSIFTAIVLLIEKQVKRGSKFWLFMAFELCFWIFFAPRGSAFYDTYNMLKFGLIFAVGHCFVRGMNKCERPVILRRDNYVRS